MTPRKQTPAQRILAGLQKDASRVAIDHRDGADSPFQPIATPHQRPKEAPSQPMGRSMSKESPSITERVDAMPKETRPWRPEEFGSTGPALIEATELEQKPAPRREPKTDTKPIHERAEEEPKEASPVSRFTTKVLEVSPAAQPKSTFSPSNPPQAASPAPTPAPPQPTQEASAIPPSPQPPATPQTQKPTPTPAPPATSSTAQGSPLLLPADLVVQDMGNRGAGAQVLLDSDILREALSTSEVSVDASAISITDPWMQSQLKALPPGSRLAIPLWNLLQHLSTDQCKALGLPGSEKLQNTAAIQLQEGSTEQPVEAKVSPAAQAFAAPANPDPVPMPGAVASFPGGLHQNNPAFHPPSQPAQQAQAPAAAATYVPEQPAVALPQNAAPLASHQSAQPMPAVSTPAPGATTEMPTVSIQVPQGFHAQQATGQAQAEAESARQVYVPQPPPGVPYASDLPQAQPQAPAAQQLIQPQAQPPAAQQHQQAAPQPSPAPAPTRPIQEFNGAATVELGS